jgi:hypothetical protein
LQKEEIDRTLTFVEQIMTKCEQWHLVVFIAKFISKTLMVCSRLKSRKLMMEKVLFHVKVCDDLLDYILPTKTIIA